MQNDLLTQELESLKIAARDRRHLDHSHRSHVEQNKGNRTDIVHAGYRFLQCVAVFVIFVFHVWHDVAEQLPGIWDTIFMVIYPVCFLASLVLGILRLTKFTPQPVIPVAISMVGWCSMLAGAILAMRHTHIELDIGTMTDNEIAMSPIYLHDLTVCGMSLVASSLYLVHAWLCYDCWWWERKQRLLREAENGVPTLRVNSESHKLGNEIPLKETRVRIDPTLEMPSTSSGQKKSSTGESDPIQILNELLRTSVQVKRIKIEDEPVRLYCCCLDLCSCIVNQDTKYGAEHEFQVIHVM